MTRAPALLCYCGCGRQLDVCHGLPRRVRRRRRRELDGLGETHDVSALFPSVRPRDSIFDAYAERVATGLDPADPSVPIDAIVQGVELLDEAERGRIVREWVRLYPDRWASVCSAVGDVSLVEAAFVASAVRGAISERRPVPRTLVAFFEGGKLRRSPAAALGLVLAPALIWNRDAATVFRQDMGRSEHLTPTDFNRAISLAYAYVGDEQVERVRVGSQRVARQLPVADLPTASDTLSRGCEIVASDDASASELAALLLVAYAQSEAAHDASRHARRGRDRYRTT
jgi:hypothetical protein